MRKPEMFIQSRRNFMRVVSMGSSAAVAYPKGLEASTPQSAGYPDLAQLRAAHERKGIIPPHKTYRTMEWEFHYPPDGNFDIDLEAAIKASRDAGAETILFYTQDCWGYSFYPTDVSLRHPNLKFDLLGREVELAHQAGMSVIAYYAVQYNNQIVLNHPDWGWVNEHGEQQRRRERWYLACMDSPYREIVLGMLDEIFSRYDAEALFLDCFGIQFYFHHREDKDPFCYCKYTEEAWNREHPGDPYREGFQSREGWEQRYRWHEQRNLYRLLDSIIATVRKRRPNTLLALNGGPEAFPNDLLQKADFIYAEPLPCTSGISLGSILMRGWGRPDYQAGVFTQQGYLDKYPSSVARVQADALIVQNARTFFIGNAPIIGGLDGQGFSKRWFRVAKEHWTDVRNVDCLLQDLQPVYSAAILYSEATRRELDAQRRPGDFRDSTLGALETLTYAGRPVESIPEFRLSPKFLSQFDTLVLPEVEVLSDAHAEMIRAWVDQGGTMLASHRAGLRDEKSQPRLNFPLADVFGVDYVSEERRYYFDPDGQPKTGFISTYLESCGHPLADLLAESTVGLPGTFLHVKPTTAVEVMRYRLPFMIEDMTKNKWFNWGPPPPGEASGGTAVAYNKFGKGQSLYIGAPLFQAMSARSGWGISDRPFWIREWIPELLRKLVSNPIAEIAPVPFTEYLHGTFFYDHGRRLVLVQALNTLELATKGKYSGPIHAEIRINPAKLRVTGARVVWPKTQDLTLKKFGSQIHIALPAVEGYVALYLKLA
jgi:hypothetical protein